MASFSSEHQARTCSRRCLSRVTSAWRWPGIPLGKAGAGVAPLEPSPPLRSPGPARAALACGELAAEPGEAARGYEQQFVFCRLPGSAQSCSAARDVLSGSTWLLSPGPVGWLALPHRPWLLLRGRSDPWLQVRGGVPGSFPAALLPWHFYRTRAALPGLPWLQVPPGHGRDHPAVPAAGSCCLSMAAGHPTRCEPGRALPNLRLSPAHSARAGMHGVSSRGAGWCCQSPGTRDGIEGLPARTAEMAVTGLSSSVLEWCLPTPANIVVILQPGRTAQPVPSPIF